MGFDDNKLQQLKQPVDIVLSYDLEKLRHENDTKRAVLWNQIKTNQTIFEREFMVELSQEEIKRIVSDFTLAKLLLATAAKSNGEKTPIIKKFNAKELDLVSNFERFNHFDVLSADEIADKMARNEEIYNLAMGFYQNEYARLDSILESQEIRKDVKIAFNKRYNARLNKIADGAKAYIQKYGVSSFVGQIEDKVKGKSQHNSETPVKDSVSDHQNTEPQDKSKINEDDDTKPAVDVVVTNPLTKEKKKLRVRAEWVGIILACLSVSGYLIGFQLWPWLQSMAKERGYTLIVSEIPSDMGVVQANPLPNSDGKYTAGTVVTLTVNIAPGDSFVMWSGDAKGTNPVTAITMNSDKQVVAEFESSTQTTAAMIKWQNYIFVNSNQIQLDNLKSNCSVSAQCSSNRSGVTLFAVSSIDSYFVDCFTVDSACINFNIKISDLKMHNGIQELFI
jgi:Divergent InlB B-repeat domain